MKPIIVVDFDGTICDSRWPECGPLKAGVKEALQRFSDLGFHILISSCRSCHWHFDVFGGSKEQPVMERVRMVEMVQYLNHHEIPYHEIDDGSRGKPFGALYIDDKGMRFTDNWPEITQWVEKNLVQ